MGQPIRLLWDAPDDGSGIKIGSFTASAVQFNRRQDDNGIFKVEFYPNTTPATVTIKIRGRMTNPDKDAEIAGAGLDVEPWSVLATVTEAELGTAGDGVFHDTLLIFPFMDVEITNNNDVANHLRVRIGE